MNFAELENPIKTLENMLGKVVYVVDYTSFTSINNVTVLSSIRIIKTYALDSYKIYRFKSMYPNKVYVDALLNVRVTDKYCRMTQLNNVFLSEEDARRYITDELTQKYILGSNVEIKIDDYTK